MRPGNNKTLWDAVHKAKNLNSQELPDTMCLDGVEIEESELPEAFATYFANKIDQLRTRTTTSDTAYNGERKIQA